MPKYKPAPFGHCAQSGEEGRAHPFIAHHPHLGQWAASYLGVALAHRAAYRRRMIDQQYASARLQACHVEMAQACKVARRSVRDVDLIAVSKTVPAVAISSFLAAGQRAFGENRVQEAQGKWPALLAEYPDTALHLVGQLQSNKAEDAVALFDTIHTLDRPSLIQALARAEEKLGLKRRYFLQVNIGAEPQKGGCAVADVPLMLAEANQAGLDVMGLMAVPPQGLEAAPYFALLAKLARDNGLVQLSMGMSGDMETAIMLGATHVRIGTALFGERSI